jgi:hypothetical protein
VADRAQLFLEVVRFWEEKGVPPCAEAQADGVPCTELGRQCESCSRAIKALNDARGAQAPPGGNGMDW